MITILSLIIALAGVIIALAGVSIAGFSLWTARQVMRHHLIGELRKEYMSPQIYYAVKTVWEFHDKCEKDKIDFVKEYKKRFDKDKKRISSLDEKERFETEHRTLHYQRRLVSHFYQYVAALSDSKILDKDILFKIWAEKDLRIIPNVIIPIEIGVSEAIQTPPERTFGEREMPDALSVLYKLYQDSKDYEAQKTADSRSSDRGVT